MSAADPSRPAVSFPEALSSREQWLEPFGWYREMRADSPVRYDADRELWDVFRYDDVKYVLDNDGLFSADPATAGFGEEIADSEGEPPPVFDTMLFADPPEHDRLRGVVAEFFSPRAINEQADRIRGLTERYLDDLNDEFDLVSELAYPMPVDVIAEMLGVPTDDRAMFKRWSDTLIERPEATTEAEMESFQQRQRETQREMSEYFSSLIETRRADPQDDLITAIIDAEVDGHRLSEREMVGFCTLLLVAGNITTTNLITNAMRCFTSRSGLFDEFRSGETELSTAIEEALRYRSPVQALFRVTTEPIDLGGREIPAGEGVVAWLGSANRDERMFDRPDEFVPDRQPNQHLSFGYGTHYCLGAPLARLEAKIALESLLERFETIEPVETDLRPIRSSFIYGVEKYPLRIR
ncbi:cytochrome P450 [Halohasta litorea]|uniref:Cytochrome P450 n=1 Tax=Halohasta litorea TaxID=869891 RepID=A0ABD6D8K0_9EURY|nr:cytochrome P450 [Halohasta litorea]